MRLNEIPNIRLSNQHLRDSKFKSAKDIVGWMGAMQAQEFRMAKWAIGIRLPGSTEKLIDSAIDKGEILRTHILRPTWHFVSSEDIDWILKLTAPKIKNSLKSAWRYFGIDETVLKKVNKVIKLSLKDGNHLTRDEIKERFEKAKINIYENRLSHLLAAAELDGVICSGVLKEGKNTYSLFEERVPASKSFSRDESLALLAEKYFRSHGPASVKDFSWWSGLNLTESGKAIEMVKLNFESFKTGTDILWFNNSTPFTKKLNNSALLLPAFDEFIVSYKDRSAVYNPENHARLISSNGIFYPLIIFKGKVKGLWKRTIKKDRVIVMIDFFQPPSKSLINSISKAAEMYASFLNKKPEIIFNS